MFKTATVVVSTVASVQASYPAQSYSHAGSQAHAASDANAASASHSAAEGAYDADAYAKQTYGSDKDSSWGRSYDSVKAQSFSDEQYARGIEADDDQWAVNYDEYEAADAGSSADAASAEVAVVDTVTVVHDVGHDQHALLPTDDGFAPVKGVSDLVNTETIDARGHYLDAFPALPTIPQQSTYGGYGQQAAHGAYAQPQV